jgi:syntaxin 16
LQRQGSGDSGSWKTKAKSLPPRWVEDIESIEEDIKQIELKSRELGQLHTKRLMVNFESDENAQEREIDYKTQEVTEIFRHAESLLKKFSRTDTTETIPAAELTVRTNIQRSIAKKLQGLSMSFRSSQKEYLNRLKKQKSGDSDFDYKAGASKSSSAMEIESDAGFTSRQMEMVDDMEDVSCFSSCLFVVCVLTYVLTCFASFLLRSLSISVTKKSPILRNRSRS